MLASINKNKKLNICILALFGLLSAICVTTSCQSKNDPSWISYYDSAEQKTIKVDLPCIDKNINALRRSQPSSFSSYNIFPNSNDLTIKVSIPISAINGVHFGSSWNKLESVPSNWLGYLFANHQTIIDINLPKNIKHTGTWFCDSLFEGNDSGSVLPNYFQIPPKIVSCSSYFLYEFCGGSNIVLPESFNLPQNIQYTEQWFCGHMFWYSTMDHIPQSFSLPKNLIYSTDESNSFREMFSHCTNLRYDQNAKPLIIPSIISPQYHSNYCDNMFSECADLISNGIPTTPQPLDMINIARK